MRIMITNDDGIKSPGLKKLAETAKKFGEVIVAAPKEQCSAMSHHITLRNDIAFSEYDFPVDGVKAYTFEGTPADCIRASFLGFIPRAERPDMVFSGINEGSNCGFDIQYSATVGAAMEALLYNVPAICFSQGFRECNLHGGEDVITDVCDKYLYDVIDELLKNELMSNCCWNVNFPNCRLEQCKGMLYDRFPSQQAFWDDRYAPYIGEDGRNYIHMSTEPIKGAEEGSDMKALLDGYISIGYVRNTVLL